MKMVIVLSILSFSFMAKAASFNCVMAKPDSAGNYNILIYNGEVAEGEFMVLKANGQTSKMTTNELGTALSTAEGIQALDKAVLAGVSGAQNSITISTMVADSTKVGTQQWVRLDAIASGAAANGVTLVSSQTQLAVACSAKP